MALITIHIEPDLDYTGTYTVKVFAIGNPSTPVLQKVYNPPFTGNIDDTLTITGYKDYDVKIYADACSKLVGSATVDAPDACGSPRLVNASPVAATTATANFSPPLSGLPITNYHWELYQGPTVVDSGDTSGTFVNLTGLTPSTSYAFRVYTRCNGNILSTYGIVNFITLAS